VDHRFSESQDLLRSTAAAFFAREFPLDRMREFHLDRARNEHELWRAICALGWNAAAFPEDVGGSPGSFMEAAVLLEEMGRAACASPYVHSTIAAGLSLLTGAPALAGRVALCEAVVVACPPTPPFPPPSLDMGALTGRLLAVPWSALATHVLVAAPDGLALVAVDGAATAREFETSAAEPVGEVELRGARPDAVLPASVADDVLRHGAAGAALVLAGAASRALDVAVAYMKERVQFGKPIGSFQALQHKAADMYIACETGRTLAYKAATLHGATEFGRFARYAKAYMSDGATKVTRDAIQLHGGVGFADNHRVQLFYRLAMSLAPAYGAPHDHRRVAADAVLAGAMG
jgi:alkylation response protein AidB-like acyl-CoA dehydrogenase